jgi:hypothetical protein
MEQLFNATVILVATIAHGHHHWTAPAACPGWFFAKVLLDGAFGCCISAHRSELLLVPARCHLVDFSSALPVVRMDLLHTA